MKFFGVIAVCVFASVAFPKDAAATQEMLLGGFGGWRVTAAVPEDASGLTRLLPPWARRRATAKPPKACFATSNPAEQQPGAGAQGSTLMVALINGVRVVLAGDPSYREEGALIEIEAGGGRHVLAVFRHGWAAAPDEPRNRALIEAMLNVVDRPSAMVTVKGMSTRRVQDIRRYALEGLAEALTLLNRSCMPVQ